MISCIAVHNVQVLDFVKMMLGCIGGIYAAYTRVETTAEDGCQSGIFKALFVCPLPAVFEVSYVFRFVIGCIQIIYPAFQTGFHDSKVLIGESYVYDDFGFETVEERHQFVYIVCIYLSGFDVRVADCFYNSVAFGFGAAGNHDFCKHIRILSYFVRNNGTYTACTDNKNFTHFSTYKSFKYDYFFSMSKYKA